MKFIQNMGILVFCMSAFLQDMRFRKISNNLILAGLITGFFYQYADKGMAGVFIFLGGTIIPVFVLGVLYYFRMLGAGDIKLFSVLGSFMGIADIFYCMAYAIFCGSIISLILVINRKNLKQRLYYFFSYTETYLRTKEWKPYRDGSSHDAEFHFVSAVFISVLLYMGGIY